MILNPFESRRSADSLIWNTLQSRDNRAGRQLLMGENPHVLILMVHIHVEQSYVPIQSHHRALQQGNRRTSIVSYRSNQEEVPRTSLHQYPYLRVEAGTIATLLDPKESMQPFKIWDSEPLAVQLCCQTLSVGNRNANHRVQYQCQHHSGL